MRGSKSSPGQRLGVAAGIVVAALSLLLAACSSGGSPSGHSGSKATKTAKPVSRASIAAADISITPADGGKDADPSAGITVTAAKGTLTSVVAHASSTASPSASSASASLTVPGTLSQGDKQWHSQWALATAQSYTVTASARVPGQGTLTRTVSFRTLTPTNTFHTQIFEGYQQTYGVGMPIMLTFSEPITNKAAVERSLQLTTSNPVTGAWYWDGDEHLNFRPQNYWPAGTKISLTGHLNGVEGASGMYGAADLTQSFDIGDSVIATTSATAHQAKIYINGSLKYTWPASTGKASTATPNGTYVSIEKENPVRMIGGTKGTPGYYNELVPYSVRFTFSGDYMHDAPWSVSDQGSSNVSHGCVNLSPTDSKIYYDMAIPGDPVTVTNSTKAGKWDDGWTEWFLSWTDLVKGSALHEAVKAGPDGSSFVDPSTVSAPSVGVTTGPTPGNWTA
ncbi:MAG TPA: Ig-like domain-containing protein [Streptosporangiaceae bacterium]|nr:Ig-like domain-containing protein [Streptosporangiaceae bacterium]